MKMDNKETRTLQLPNEGREGRNISGYAANFLEYDMGGFRERIEPTAFRDLSKHDIHALYNHDYNKVLARSNKGEGTLDLSTDEQGLKFGFELPDTPTGNEVRDLVERGDVNQASWAFTVDSEEWQDVRSEKPLRVIKEVGGIFDISITPRGANPSTSVALRSLEAAQKEETPEVPVIEEPKTIRKVEENTEKPTEKEARFIDASEVQGKLSKSEARDLNKFNIVKAINEARNGKLTGLEAEINQEGMKEKRELNQEVRDMHAVNLPEMVFNRTQTAGTANVGGDLVFTEPGRYVDFLYPNTPMLRRCAIAENLVGNVDFPRQTSSYSLNWQTETGTDTAQDINFDKVSMNPKRAVITASFSNQLLRQEYSRGIEQRIINQMNASFNKGLENAVLNGSGSSNQPSGIYTELAGQALTIGAVSYDDLVDMENALAAADALEGNLAYVAHPDVVAKLKKTKVDAGSGRFLVEGMLDPQQTANGYAIDSTTLSLKNTTPDPDTYGLLFGNFNDVQIGFWGGATILIDPYTQMKSSIVEVNLERFMDVAVLRPASFAISTDVTV